MKNFLQFILGLGLVLIGVLVARSSVVFLTKKYVSGWSESTGELIAFEKHLLNENDMEYEPIVIFEEGENYHEKVLARTKSEPEIGQEVAVLYNPKNPSESIVGGMGDWDLVGLAPFLAGIALMVLSISRVLRKGRVSFEEEGANDRSIAHLRRTGVQIWGKIVDIEVVDSSRGRAIIQAKTLDGQLKNHRSDVIDGLTHGALVAYLANPAEIVIFVNPDNIEDYFINSEDVVEAISRNREKFGGKNV